MLLNYLYLTEKKKVLILKFLKNIKNRLYAINAWLKPFLYAEINFESKYQINVKLILPTYVNSYIFTGRILNFNKNKKKITKIYVLFR